MSFWDAYWTVRSFYGRSRRHGSTYKMLTETLRVWREVKP